MAQAPPVALAMAARTALNAGAVFFSSSASTASISLRMSPIPAAREHRQSASIRNRFRTEHATRKMGAVHKVACPIFGSSPQPPPAEERDHGDHQRQEGVEPDEHFEGGHARIRHRVVLLVQELMLPLEQMQALFLGPLFSVFLPLACYSTADEAAREESVGRCPWTPGERQ